MLKLCLVSHLYSVVQHVNSVVMFEQQSSDFL